MAQAEQGAGERPSYPTEEEGMPGELFQGLSKSVPQGCSSKQEP